MAQQRKIGAGSSGRYGLCNRLSVLYLMRWARHDLRLLAIAQLQAWKAVSTRPVNPGDTRAVAALALHFPTAIW